MRFHPSRAALIAALPLLALSACRRGRAPETQPAPEPAPVAVEAPAPRFRTGTEVVDAMRDRYAGKWYTTLTFKQKTSRLLPSGKWNVQTWWEAMKLPGRLRIDFDPVRAGNGVLYARDSQFVVQNGRALRGDPGINPLLLLGFDVYTAPVSYTTTRLRREGFDLTRVHETTFQNRPVIVVGARKGDFNRKQFWVDAERMLLLRLLWAQPAGARTVVTDYHVTYQDVGGFPVPQEIVIHRNGRPYLRERYAEVRPNAPLEPSLFDPAQWARGAPAR